MHLIIIGQKMQELKAHKFDGKSLDDETEESHKPGMRKVTPIVPDFKQPHERKLTKSEIAAVNSRLYNKLCSEVG